MWYRSGAVAVLGCLLACGDAAKEPQNAGTASTSGAEPPGQAEPNPPGMGLRLSVDGWSEDIGAKAQLNVKEGESVVRLAITGSEGQNLLLLDIDFESLDQTMGSHQVEVGLPYTELDSAFANLDGLSYHSQGGHMDVSLAADGTISGSFDLELSEDPETAAGQTPVFVLAEDVRRLEGSFSGRWELQCQSYMDGHSTLRLGGAYCDALEF